MPDIINPIRKCGECSKCCEGWVHGQIFGVPFYKGRPCFYLEKGCTIYKQRPENPCRIFKCVWLGEEVMPMWMRPDLIDVIVVKRLREGIEYYKLIEMGKKLDSAVLNWFVMWAISEGKNILYFINDGSNRIGSEQFLKIDVNEV